MKTTIHSIIEHASQAKTQDEKIAILRHFESFALRTILQGIYDPRIKFALPAEISYKPSKDDSHNLLYVEARRLYIFTEGGPNLTDERRLKLFLDIVERIEPEEAYLLMCMKDKKPPFEGLSYNDVYKAFPLLLPEPEKKPLIEAIAPKFARKPTAVSRKKKT
jgi:hypothetical protein